MQENMNGSMNDRGEKVSWEWDNGTNLERFYGSEIGGESCRSDIGSPRRTKPRDPNESRNARKANSNCLVESRPRISRVEIRSCGIASSNDIYLLNVRIRFSLSIALIDQPNTQGLGQTEWKLLKGRYALSLLWLKGRQRNQESKVYLVDQM